jgi:3-dehydroquinate dehydratase-2
VRRHRVLVLHGVNIDQLGVRDPEHYGNLGMRELEVRVRRFAHELGIEATFTQTNHEGIFCEALHDARDTQDGLVLNPGAWTHYSWAIRDALEISGLPAVEVHLSAISEREEWRRISVIRELCVASVEGKGVDGYREALEALSEEFRR